jgi:hypothetical protein
MNSPDFPFASLLILTFFAGFACAIWLAVTLDEGAREIAEKAEDDAQNVAEP